VTPAERAARAQRAQGALDEFLTPLFTDIRSTYSARLIEIASTELNRDKRTDKITALSNALRIVEQLEAGMVAIVKDGEVARSDLLHAAKIEDMTPSQRRLLGFAPGWNR
jgi:hypothetical protein